MAFISSGYNPAKPMENRITDIGPRPYDEGFPAIIKNNFGKWLYHEILEPGVLVHVAESGDKVYTVRVGTARLMSVTLIREACEIADKYCGGHLRFTTRNNIEFMVDNEADLKALKDDLVTRSLMLALTSSPLAELALVSATLYTPKAGYTATPLQLTLLAQLKRLWTKFFLTSKACVCLLLCAFPLLAASTCAALYTAQTSALLISTESPQ